MRKLVIVIAVAAGLVVGLPPIFGYVTAAQVEDGLAELETLELLDAEIVGYERGWFTSRARIAVDARAALPAGLAEQAAAAVLGAERPVVVVDLAHGPIAVLGGVSVGTSRFVARLDPATAGVGNVLERLNVPHLFEFRGRTSFLGTLVYDADVPAFEAALGPNERLTFSGLDVAGNYARGQLVAAAAAESLAIATAGGTFSFDALAIDLDQDLYERTGGGTIALERSTLVDAFGTQPIFAIADLRLESATATGTRAGLRDARFAFTAASVGVAEWDVTAAELALDLRNVDLEAVERFGRMAEAFDQLDPAPLVERLLAAGPVLTVDPVRFRVDDEPLTATVSVVTKPGALPPAGALDIYDPSLWLAAFDASATLEVAKPLATRIGALLAAQQIPLDGTLTEEQRQYFAEAQAGLTLAVLMGQGLLVESGDNYRVEIEARDGALTVNGQPLL